MHRIFLQGLMCRGIVDANEALKLYEFAAIRCHGEVSDDRNEKFKKMGPFVRQINEQLEKLGMKILKVSDEFKTVKASFFTLIVTTERNDATMLNKRAMVDFGAHELELLKLVTEKIMEEEDRIIDQTTAINLAMKVKTKKMTLKEGQDALRRFINDKWLHTNNGQVGLSARFIAEMEDYLKDTFGTAKGVEGSVGECGLCKKIVVRALTCECDERYHYYCANALPEAARKCSTCRQKLEIPRETQTQRGKKRAQDDDDDESD